MLQRFRVWLRLFLEVPTLAFVTKHIAILQDHDRSQRDRITALESAIVELQGQLAELKAKPVRPQAPPKQEDIDFEASQRATLAAFLEEGE